MKLLKKLLPIATIASTAAVVAPMVTSCSAVASTSDLEYKPSAQYNNGAATEIDLTKESAITDYNNLVKDFFKDNGKYVKEDILYFLAQGAKAAKEKIEKDFDKIKDFKFSANMSINSFDIKETTYSYETFKDFNAYIGSMKITFTLNASGSLTEEKTEGSNKKSEYKANVNQQFELEVKDGIFMINPLQVGSKQYLTILFDDSKGDWSKLQKASASGTLTTIDTYVDGKVLESKQDIGKDDEFEYYSKKNGDKSTDLGLIAYSYYLQNVTFKLA